MAFALSLINFSLTLNPMSLILIGGLVAVVPLIVFLFETNFARNLSIFSTFKFFIIGGLLSIITTFVIRPWVENEVLLTVLLAPVFEEIAKALVVLFFLSRLRTNSMLTGLLVGFTVGAGFDVFETLDYAFSAVLLTTDAFEAIIGAIATLISRSVVTFFVGHHYFAGIFGAVYILSKRTPSFAVRDIFQWRVGAALLVSMALHSLWNATSFFAPFWASFVQVIVCIACVAILFLLINVGIAQAKIMEIFENASSADGEAEEAKEEPV